MRSSVASKPSLDKLTGPVETLSGGEGLHMSRRLSTQTLRQQKICEILKVEGEKCLKVEAFSPSTWPGQDERYRKAPAFRPPHPWPSGEKAFPLGSYESQKSRRAYRVLVVTTLVALATGCVDLAETL